MSTAVAVKEISNAIGAHGAWKLRLRTAIVCGRCDVTPAQVRCDDQCEFGRWLYGPGLSEAMKAGKPYAVVKRLHSAFHHSAAQVLDQALRQNGAAADTLMKGEFAERSETLVRALTKWKAELAG